MYQTQIMPKVLDFHKAMFDTSFSAMAAVQDQAGELLDKACGKQSIIPESGKQACTHWMDFFKQNRTNYKDYVDASFDRVKEFFEDASSVNGATKK